MNEGLSNIVRQLCWIAVEQIHQSNISKLLCQLLNGDIDAKIKESQRFIYSLY